MEVDAAAWRRGLEGDMKTGKRSRKTSKNVRKLELDPQQKPDRGRAVTERTFDDPD